MRIDPGRRARYAMLGAVKPLVVAVLLLGGCSFALVRSDPPCTRLPAYADTAVAVILAVIAADRLSQHASDNAAGEVLGQAAAFGAGSAAFAISAVYGYIVSSSCHPVADHGSQ